ncbi:Tyrosine kinase domain protein [Ceratobasidium sp. AG-Ba]|nr:Tyrosine kinase domain protein [Ceratobasidium sp. AG-Ba]
MAKKDVVVRDTRTQEVIIDQSTPLSVIVRFLSEKGCSNLTEQIVVTGLQGPSSGGGSCDVFHGSLADGTQVAVKTPRTLVMAPSWTNAIYAWSKCKHENILPLLGFAIFRGQLAAVSPWMEEGTLPSYLRRHPDTNKSQICRQVCEAVQYLHDRNIVHGDINGKNILVSNRGRPLLHDFGLVTLLADDLNIEPEDQDFAYRWSAPELFTSEAPLRTKATDIYSLGMTLLEAVTGEVPFGRGKSDRAFMIHVVQGEVPERPTTQLRFNDPASDGLWALLRRCWARNPRARPGISLVIHMSALGEGHFQRPQNVGRTSESASQQSMRFMTTAEAMRFLSERGCPNITEQLDLEACSTFPEASHGTFGDVYSGRLKSQTHIAIKTLRMRFRDNDDGHKLLKHSAHELHVWAKCDHPNVLPLLGLVEFQSKIGMVARWAQNGDLSAYVGNNPGVNLYNLVWFKITDVATGLVYLHAQGIVHGDIKPSNVLVSAHGVPMIGDFGSAMLQDGTVNFASVTKEHTCQYSAPELLRTGESTFASDVYALGMTKPNLTLRHEKEIPTRPESFKPDDQKHDRLWSLLCRCWVYEAKDRPSAAYVEEEGIWLLNKFNDGDELGQIIDS